MRGSAKPIPKNKVSVRICIHPNYDVVCFLSQQMAVKYMKGFLQEHGAPFRKTHNLIELLNLCLSLDAWDDIRAR